MTMVRDIEPPGGGELADWWEYEREAERRSGRRSFVHRFLLPVSTAVVSLAAATLGFYLHRDVETVAVRPLHAGHVLSEVDLRVERSTGAREPYRRSKEDRLVGRALAMSASKGDRIRPHLVMPAVVVSQDEAVVPLVLRPERVPLDVRIAARVVIVVGANPNPLQVVGTVKGRAERAGGVTQVDVVVPRHVAADLARAPSEMLSLMAVNQ